MDFINFITTSQLDATGLFLAFFLVSAAAVIRLGDAIAVGRRRDKKRKMIERILGY